MYHQTARRFLGSLSLKGHHDNSKQMPPSAPTTMYLTIGNDMD